ncbi:IclR family transcriptional regulator [Salinicoccus halodurans]|nr:IclR family transcriptional regulator C-terminal domain-containing protein [Salinicoccus halodurans]
MSVIRDHSYDSFDDLIEMATPIMQEINEEIGESVNLTVVRGSKVKVLAHLESRHNLKYSYVEGQILDIFKGASSKILLAHLPAEHQQFLMETGMAADHRKSLENELGQIKANGYAVTSSEVDENAIGISTPILRSGKYIIGGLSIAGPIFRIKGDKIESYVERLKEAAFDISLMLEDN